MTPDLLRPPRQITFDNLARYEETLKPPFRRAFGDKRVDLLPPPQPSSQGDDLLANAASKGKAVYDERGRRLVVPLGSDGQLLGLLVIHEVSSEQISPLVSPFLSSLVETALDLVRLRLEAQTDPVTGLATEMALDESLAAALSRLTPSKVRSRPSLDHEAGEKGLSLLALEPEGMASLRDRHGRRFGDRLLKEIARKLDELGPQALCASRVGHSLLLLIDGGASVTRDMAARLRLAVKALDLATSQGEVWRGDMRMGAATVDAQSWEGGALPAEAAAVFKARSLRALSFATRVGLQEVLFFGEIVDKAGRILEIMPLDRVRLDLGRVHGLAEGERFQVVAPAPEAGGQLTAKAEILVVSLGEEESVAEVVNLLDPTWSLRPGDRLRRLTHDAASQSEAALELTVTLAGREFRVLLDEVTGLACHRSFMALFSAMCAAEPIFSVVLVRIEGLEGIREVLGRLGADSLMSALGAVAREVIPFPELLGRFAPDTLAALLPAVSPQEAQDLATQVLARLGQKIERGLRAGVAYHPCPGFGPADCLDSAAKALVHAGFLEPGSVVIFDALSLAVSGDALFNQGRLSEAVVEYERALLLSPQEPNVLNCLGACYGHLGQMDRATGYFERALAAAPDDFMAHYNLGYALMAQGRLAEAGQRLEQSLALEPEHADTLFQLGRLAQGEGRMAVALDLLTRAASRADCRKAVHRHLGEVLAASGRPAEAEEAFKQAAKANPNDAAALVSLAGLYLERKANLDIALSLSRRARELEPASSRPSRVMSQALMALGRLDEARDLLREAQAQHPHDPFLAVQLGRLELSRGDLAAARDEFLRALALEPNLQAAKDGLASLKK